MLSKVPPSSPCPQPNQSYGTVGGPSLQQDPLQMKLAFHKGARGTFFSKAICAFTRSQYSHVELVFYGPNRNGWSWCFSSDEQDGGTRFKSVQLLLDDWDLVEIPTTEFFYNLAWNYASSKRNLKYDWLGILGFVVPFGEHDDLDRFCSEIVAEILEHTYGWNLGKPWMISPGELYNKIQEVLHTHAC